MTKKIKKLLKPNAKETKTTYTISYLLVITYIIYSLVYMYLKYYRLILIKCYANYR